MVLTYGSILSCFWCPAFSAVIRTHVEKPVLSMCANILTPPPCCGVFTPKRFRVRDGTIYIYMFLLSGIVYGEAQNCKVSSGILSRTKHCVTRFMTRKM